MDIVTEYFFALRDYSGASLNYSGASLSWLIGYSIGIFLAHISDPKPWLIFGAGMFFKRTKNLIIYGVISMFAMMVMIFAIRGTLPFSRDGFWFLSDVVRTFTHLFIFSVFIFWKIKKNAKRSPQKPSTEEA